MTGRLDEKAILVTGGAAGIGRATAIAAAVHGAKVAVSDINVPGGEETVRMIHALGGTAHFFRADVANEEEVEALVHTTVGQYGRLDGAFNNAGVGGTLARIAECSRENWDQVLSINLTGVWLCLKYEIGQMLKQGGGGTIVNTASVAGLQGNPLGMAAYIASKHGVVGLTKAAGIEYARSGIRVNAVCPSFIDTVMVKELTDFVPKIREMIPQTNPLGRIGTPEEVANAVVWLLSDASSYVNAHSLPIDGGLTVM